MRDMATSADRLKTHLTEKLVGTEIKYCPDVLAEFFKEVKFVGFDIDTETMIDNGNYIACNVYECDWNDPARSFVVRVYYEGLTIIEIYVDEFTD